MPYRVHRERCGHLQLRSLLELACGISGFGQRLRASFRSKVTYEGQLTAERNSGRIELLFRLDGGQVRITRILVYTG